MTRIGRRTQRRYRCRSCGRTFAANVGTPYHRLRHSPGRFDQVAALAAGGMSKSGIAQAVGLSLSTVSRWTQKAAAYAEAFQDVKVQRVEAIEIERPLAAEPYFA